MKKVIPKKFKVELILRPLEYSLEANLSGRKTTLTMDDYFNNKIIFSTNLLIPGSPNKYKIIIEEL